MLHSILNKWVIFFGLDDLRQLLFREELRFILCHHIPTLINCTLCWLMHHSRNRLHCHRLNQRLDRLRWLKQRMHLCIIILCIYVCCVYRSSKLLLLPRKWHWGYIHWFLWSGLESHFITHIYYRIYISYSYANIAQTHVVRIILMLCILKEIVIIFLIICILFY